MPATAVHKKTVTNLLLTIPDRGGHSKEAWIDWIRSVFPAAAPRPALTSNLRFFAGVREPYAKPKAGMTHHFHFGLCWEKPVLLQAFFKKCVNPVNHPLGAIGGDIDFHKVSPKRGLPASKIFLRYFQAPSKYKALDEHLTLVSNLPPLPTVPDKLVTVKDGLKFIDYFMYEYKCEHDSSFVA